MNTILGSQALKQRIILFGQSKILTNIFVDYDKEFQDCHFLSTDRNVHKIYEWCVLVHDIFERIPVALYSLVFFPLSSTYSKYFHITSLSVFSLENFTQKNNSFSCLQAFFDLFSSSIVDDQTRKLCFSNNLIVLIKS